jgi:ABC-2 type transport system ATP-binding protein
MITVENLVKQYGTGDTKVTAVAGMSFEVRPGVVTGFLGPNGAGKSTTMRVILGLDKPTSGRAQVNGRNYRASEAPLSEIGALLDGRAFDPGRSAINHLRVVAATAGISRQRVEEVLELAGLSTVGHLQAGGFSLGMGQRLGIATALLGDPEVLMLDEPTNGLDPDGIQWIRSLTRSLAAEGRTIFISSHLMSEMELTADHLIVVGAGQVIVDEPMQALIDRTSGEIVQVKTPRAHDLHQALARKGVQINQTSRDELQVAGLSAAEIGDAALAQGIALHGLEQQRKSLEEVFMGLTSGATVYAAQSSGDTPPGKEAA